MSVQLLCLCPYRRFWGDLLWDGGSNPFGPSRVSVMAIAPICWIAFSIDVDVQAVVLGEVHWSTRLRADFEAGIVLERTVHCHVQFMNSDAMHLVYQSM